MYLSLDLLEDGIQIFASKSDVLAFLKRYNIFDIVAYECNESGKILDSCDAYILTSQIKKEG